jgi:hypothetical protein
LAVELEDIWLLCDEIPMERLTVDHKQSGRGRGKGVAIARNQQTMLDVIFCLPKSTMNSFKDDLLTRLSSLAVVKDGTCGFCVALPWNSRCKPALLHLQDRCVDNVAMRCPAC